jgi:hypothetical protein
MSAFGDKADIGPLSTFFNSETVNWLHHHLILGLLGLLRGLP